MHSKLHEIREKQSIQRTYRRSRAKETAIWMYVFVEKFFVHNCFSGYLFCLVFQACCSRIFKEKYFKYKFKPRDSYIRYWFKIKLVIYAIKSGHKFVEPIHFFKLYSHFDILFEKRFRTFDLVGYKIA